MSERAWGRLSEEAVERFPRQLASARVNQYPRAVPSPARPKR